MPLPDTVVLENRLGIDAEQLRVGPDVALAERPGRERVEVVPLQGLQVMASDPRRVGNGIERQSARLARPSQPLPEGVPVANVPPPPQLRASAPRAMNLHLHPRPDR